MDLSKAVLPGVKGEKVMFQSRVRARVQAAGVGVLLLSQIVFTSWCMAQSAEEYLKDANAYLEKGDLNSAIIQFKNAVKEDPKNGAARFSLGQTYLLKGDVGGAEKELQRAQRLGVEDEKVLPLLGRTYLMQGKGKELLDSLVPKDSMSTKLKGTLHVLRGQAFLLQGDKAKAKDAFDQAMRLDPKNAGALVGQARLAALDNHAAEAMKLVDKAAAEDPNDAESLALGGEILRQQGEMAKALSYFEKAIAVQPRHYAALLGLATVQIALGENAKAETTLKKVYELVPKSPHANHLKAILLLRAGDSAGAEELLQQVLRILPDYLPSEQLLASINYANGKYEQAEYLLTRVVNQAPGNLVPMKLLGATYLKQSQGKKAIDLLESIPNAPANDAQYWGLLGSAYMQINNLEKGTEYLQKAAEVSPDAAAIRTQLALGRLASGDTSAAVKDLEKAISLDQNVFQADVLLVMVHLKNREFDKALTEAKAFSEKLPKNPLPYNLMGAAYFGLQQADKAKESFEKALQLEPKFSPALMNLARLAEDKGDNEKAKQYFERVLKNNAGHEGAHLALARLAGQSGDLERMRVLLEESWERNSGAINTGLALVDYYNRTQQSMRAIGIAREIKNKFPKETVGYRVLGASQMLAKDYHSAKGTYAAWVDMDKASPEARFQLGQSQLALGEDKEAKASLKEAVKLGADFLPAQLALAAIYNKEKNYKAALDIAATIQGQRPKDPMGYRLEGDVYTQKGDYKQAIKAYSKGLEKAPASMLAAGKYEARLKAGDKGALTTLEKWLADNPNDHPSRMMLAGAYQQSGALEKSEQAYRLLLQQAPRNVAVLNNLAWVASELKRPDASALAQKAYDLAPENPAVMDTYGWLLVKGGDSTKAVNILQQAVALAPHIAEIRYHYGVALHRLGRDKEAKSELSRALDMSRDFTEAKSAEKLLGEL